MGLVVLGVVAEDLGPERPHLVDLGGVLDEVARDARARQPRVADVGEDPVQHVPELVERGVDLVEREQGGLAVRRPRHVEVDDRHGLLPSRCDWSTKVLIQAPPRLVGRAYQSARNSPMPLALVVEDLVDRDVGVIGGQVVAALEAQPVELVRGVEDAVLDDVLEPEPRPQRVGVDVEPLPAHPLGVERPVPRLQRALLAVGLEEHLELARLGVRVLDRGPDECAEHRGHRLARARRLVRHDVRRRGPRSRAVRPARRAARPSGRASRGCRSRCRADRGNDGARAGAPDVAAAQRRASAGCTVGRTRVSSQPSSPRSAAAARAAPRRPGRARRARPRR